VRVFASPHGSAQCAPLGGVDRRTSLAQRCARLDGGLDLLGQANLVVLGQERVLPDIIEIETDKILVVALESPLSCRHQLRISDVESAALRTSRTRRASAVRQALRTRTAPSSRSGDAAGTIDRRSCHTFVSRSSDHSSSKSVRLRSPH
jgi:hypothetical protein